MIRKLCVFCYLLISLFSISPIYAKDKHVKETFDKEIARLATVSKNLFDAEQWDKLEQLFTDARDKQKLTSFGSALLECYYAGCGVGYHYEQTEPDAKWLDYYNKLDKWEKAKPNSITVTCLKLDFGTSYAWKARGIGYSVTKEGRKLYAERLTKAEELYNKTKKQYGKKLVPCPQFYKNALSISLGKSWKTKRTYDELVLPVIKNWPLYYGVYTRFCNRLQPQWYGEEGDDYAFYNNLKKLLGGELGKEVCAMCIFEAYGTSINNYRFDLVDQDDMIEGLVSHVKRNPNDVDLIKRVITFSTRYDFETSQQLIKDLRKITPETFKQFVENFGYGASIKAMMDTPKKSIKLEYFIRPESTPFIRTIRSVSTQDGVDHFVYAQGWSSLTVVRNSDCKILAMVKSTRQNSICFENVALSKSGDHIFVEVREKGRRMFRIYTFKNNKLELIKNVPGPLGFTEKAEFVENDETILLAGEEKGSNFKRSLYYRWKWKTEKPQLIAKTSRGFLTRMTVLEDKKQAICYSAREIFYYNYTEEKPKIHKLNLDIGEKNAHIYNIHYAKEINSLGVLTGKGNWFAVLDADTYEVKTKKMLNAKPAIMNLVDGYKYGKNEYTFCLSGFDGQISIFQYNSKKKEPLSYESTWVNAEFHASHLSVVEMKGVPPRIIQAYHRSGILGSYLVKKKQ